MSAEPAVPLDDSIRIPTLPGSVSRIRDLLARPDGNVADLAEAFLADPPLTAKVLRIANSAFYGRREKTINVSTALAYLGTRTLSMIVLRAGVFSAFDRFGERERAAVEGIWRHSILTGQVCEDLAARVRRRATDWTEKDHHACGLLHDVGKIVLFDNFGETYGELLRAASSRGETLEQAEQAKLGMRHSEVGHMAATFWGIPEPIPSMIRHLHRRAVPHDCLDVTLAVRAADEIANAVERNPAGDLKSIRSTLETTLPGMQDAALAEVIRLAQGHLKRIEP